jgi:hypothetical protein
MACSDRVFRCFWVEAGAGASEIQVLVIRSIMTAGIRAAFLVPAQRMERWTPGGGSLGLYSREAHKSCSVVRGRARRHTINVPGGSGLLLLSEAIGWGERYGVTVYNVVRCVMFTGGCGLSKRL